MCPTIESSHYDINICDQFDNTISQYDHSVVSNNHIPLLAKLDDGKILQESRKPNIFLMLKNPWVSVKIFP